jgi:hypothetical protein
VFDVGRWSSTTQAIKSSMTGDRQEPGAHGVRVSQIRRSLPGGDHRLGADVLGFAAIAQDPGRYPADRGAMRSLELGDVCAV